MLRILPLACLVAILSGCASSTWIAPDAGPAPSSLVIRMATPRQNLPDWVGKTRPVDSVKIGRWLQPRLAEGIKTASGLDSIFWDDTLELVDDSMEIDGKRHEMQRPVVSGGSGWLLVIAPMGVYYTYPTGGSWGGLSMYGNYILIDRASGKILAKGRRWLDTHTFGVNEKDWAATAKGFGREIGAKLPRR